MTIENGDIVSTPNGLGIVIDNNIYKGIFSPFCAKKCRVKLENSGEIKVFDRDLIEILTQKSNLKKSVECLSGYDIFSEK